VNTTELLVPPGVETVTSRGPRAAAVPICRVTVARVEFTIVTAVTVISGPGLNTKPDVKFVPRTSKLRVTVCPP